MLMMSMLVLQTTSFDINAAYSSSLFFVLSLLDEVWFSVVAVVLGCPWHAYPPLSSFFFVSLSFGKGVNNHPLFYR